MGGGLTGRQNQPVLPGGKHVRPDVDLVGAVPNDRDRHCAEPNDASSAAEELESPGDKIRSPSTTSRSPTRPLPSMLRRAHDAARTRMPPGATSTLRSGWTAPHWTAGRRDKGGSGALSAGLYTAARPGPP